MILVEVKDNEGLDRALKRFKKKVERVGVLKQARQRMAYTKPTVSRKAQKLKAMYKYRMLHGNNG
ncbi:MAG: 30S ribosomal protein S21 [Candidatus Cardinium sp.]|uniref:30S ribosomal protein S21 n=1 Tax=Cardinium endosymbiont of Dermatophagoides farinae TaxID=2597823 RepID=UPI00118428A4|nr:30S ribosomal protein S21 [Cardinium endosymbiont of Dermatophagoides farinae]TSJ80592.1 30S ribosomal protein S21 [Cardinium endosymbiont of Dermatophagoides farinae]UWW96580.1 MAG: 30S ribosomal protein S21 [Candidatus Cardinium sp.]